MADEINRVLYSDDCLNVLNDELALPTGCVDLIYLDPPFNSKSRYNLPFAGKDKDARPVEAFNDTWSWGIEEDALLADLTAGPRTRQVADLVAIAQRMEQGQASQHSLAAYLLNMAVRLMAMRRVLSPTGSIYLHCDPTASHYLKVLMDAVFGKKHMRREIVWDIAVLSGYKTVANNWIRGHDTILYYTKSDDFVFNRQRQAHRPEYLARFNKTDEGGERYFDGRGKRRYLKDVVAKGKAVGDVWADIMSFQQAPTALERLGYPTQKPLALLERVVKASSNPGDLVLDPFCGCGTAVHAAENLGRRWVGIDVSTFAVGLMRGRVLSNFPLITTDDVLVRGVPVNAAEAQVLADRDKFEFEKWACGAIGAEGMFREPGTPGADGGVDGVLKFWPIRFGSKPKPEYAIVQVKGGGVSADAVRALHTTVRRFEARAGVMVCFARHMRTVENQRGHETFRDDFGTYPVIQGLSVEDLLNNKRPVLPFAGYRPRGGLVGRVPLVQPM